MWQIVTVALPMGLFWIRMLARGLPTMLLGPRSPRAPPSIVRLFAGAIEATPCGVHGQQGLLADDHLADVDRVEPVHVLVRVDGQEHLATRSGGAAAAIEPGCRDFGSPFDPPDEASSSYLRSICGRRLS